VRSGKRKAKLSQFWKRYFPRSGGKSIYREDYEQRRFERQSEESVEMALRARG